MKSLIELREETMCETRLLWHSDFWDGPLTGLMLWNGEKAWFKKIDERTEKEAWTQQEIDEWEADHEPMHADDYYEYETCFIYKVYKVTLEQLNALEFNHYQFQKYVGIHCDYDKDGHRELGALRPYSEHHKFYNDTKKQCSVSSVDYSDSNVIGEFEA